MKYLHHEAKVFDIGIYFEANGHGTVLFKPALLQRLQDMDEQVRPRHCLGREACCAAASMWVHRDAAVTLFLHGRSTMPVHPWVTCSFFAYLLGTLLV